MASFWKKQIDHNRQENVGVSVALDNRFWNYCLINEIFLNLPSYTAFVCAEQFSYFLEPEAIQCF